MTQSGPVEKQVQAWLDTIDASGPQTIQTMPAATNVPTSRDLSTQRAAVFLAQLAERGRPVELRTGKVIGEGGMGIVREAEQVALGRRVLSERTDVYLAGAVLYELIAGHPPHQGDTAIAIMTSVVLSRPRIPRDAPAELDERPALLATAQEMMTAQTERKARLEKQSQDADPTVHPTTRKIVLAIGAAFVALPLIAWARPDVGLRGHPQQVVFGAVFFVAVSVISLLMRRARLTAVNRRIFTTVQFLFLSQAVLALGMWKMGLPHASTQVLNLVLWGAVCGMFALAIDRWLLVVSVMYFLAFLVASSFPDHRLLAVSAANLSLTLALHWRWRPVTRSLLGGKPGS